MKLTLFALLATILVTSGCTNTIYTHRKDFSPVDRQGTWNDYYQAKKEGRQWTPKEHELPAKK
jgi:hypothetical protein